MGDGVDIVGVGLATLDILVRQKDLATWEHGTMASDFAFDGGGMTGTAMSAAARLGARAGYIGTVGAGIAGEIKLRSLTDRGVDVSITHRQSAPERQVVIVNVNETDGERVFTCVNFGDKEPLILGEADRRYITSAKLLLLDGFHHVAAVQAAKWMRQAGDPARKVVLDGTKTSGRVGEEMRELVALSDVLICGSGFAPGLTGEKDVWKAGRAALAMGPSVVVQTEGAAGCYTVTAGAQFHTPAFKVDVVDTTGAGDVFHGAYLVGMLKGWPLEKVARFASAVAAIKCMHLGGRAGIPTFEQTMAFLRERGASEF
ncbi:MAG: PfkB family carbohydrate kinase [Phycisphaerae bacterium]